MSRRSTRQTPLRGSPIGKVRMGGREHTDKFVTVKAGRPDDFHHLETACFCGLPFPDHTPEELAYIQEHNRCQRVARKA